jgi:hypothetical protein
MSQVFLPPHPEPTPRLALNPMAHALSSDIERALQNAVGEANNAFSDGIAAAADGGTSKILKKRKRVRDLEDEGETEVESADEGEVEVEQVKEAEKKRRKKKSKGGVGEESRDGTEETSTTTTPGATDTSTAKKKKKSKNKDKGKQPATVDNLSGFPPQTVYTPAPFDVGSNQPASTAAFISALVSAASEDTQTQSQEQPPAAAAAAMSSAQPQYMYPLPPMGYTYPAPGPHQPGSQQHPTIFSTPMGVPLNDLAFGSNEDILRALQDLDMGKIANVLKTLGEAAAAAHLQTPHPHSHPHSLPPPPPLGQVPSSAGEILTSAGSGELKQSKPTRNAIDISLVTGGSPGGKDVNADHAYLLANKWMNAGKLGEMVKTQGEFC